MYKIWMVFAQQRPVLEIFLKITQNSNAKQEGGENPQPGRGGTPRFCERALFSQIFFAKIGGRPYSEKYFLLLFQNRGRAYFEIGGVILLATWLMGHTGRRHAELLIFGRKIIEKRVAPFFAENQKLKKGESHYSQISLPWCSCPSFPLSGLEYHNRTTCSRYDEGCNRWNELIMRMNRLNIAPEKKFLYFIFLLYLSYENYTNFNYHIFIWRCCKSILFIYFI